MRWSSQYERLPVFGTRHAIATSHPAATAIGHAVLQSGGNAVDAALAASAALCVVEPGMTGIGGDCFALYYDARRARVIGINGSGWAPSALPGHLALTDADSCSAQAVTLPGAVDAWCRLSEDHGSRPLDELFAPAIRLASEGYPVHARVAWDWGQEAARLATHAATAQALLPGGRAPAAGDRHAQPALARTFAAIARNGRAGFYEGPVAEDMVATLQGLGGSHRLEDFAACRSSYVEPIATSFAGHRILECPPNGQGVIALLLLNILSELLDGKVPGEAEAIHLLAEATTLAYDVRDAVLADPPSLGEDLQSLLSPERARRLAASLPSGGAPLTTHGRDTTYLCAVDGDGNAISFINSLFDAYGSCILAPESGVLFNNRGLCFSPIEGHPNAIAPGKRPMQTIIPGMITTEAGLPVAPFGVMGGHYQATGHANFALNLLLRGMDPQQSLNAPRSFASGGMLRVEPTLDAAIVAELKGRGHRVEISEKPIGGGQAIQIDMQRGVLIAASDPRKDGSAFAL